MILYFCCQVFDYWAVLFYLVVFIINEQVVGILFTVWCSFRYDKETVLYTSCRLFLIY